MDERRGMHIRIPHKHYWIPAPSWRIHIGIYIRILSSTFGCCYNAVKYNTTLHTALQWLRQIINQTLNPNGLVMGCFLRILEKIDRVITVPHSISNHLCSFSTAKLNICRSEYVWHWNVYKLYPLQINNFKMWYLNKLFSFAWKIKVWLLNICVLIKRLGLHKMFTKHTFDI